MCIETAQQNCPPKLLEEPFSVIIKHYQNTVRIRQRAENESYLTMFAFCSYTSLACLIAQPGTLFQNVIIDVIIRLLWVKSVLQSNNV